MSDYIPRPEDWPPPPRDRGNQCDMLIGPCGCGAMHTIDDVVKELGEALGRSSLPDTDDDDGWKTVGTFMCRDGR